MGTNEWISVKERLPESQWWSEPVLVFRRNGSIGIDIHGSEKTTSLGWRSYLPFNPHRTEIEITHWMPLPEPPKTK